MRCSARSEEKRAKQVIEQDAHIKGEKPGIPGNDPQQH